MDKAREARNEALESERRLYAEARQLQEEARKAQEVAYRREHIGSLTNSGNVWKRRAQTLMRDCFASEPRASS